MKDYTKGRGPEMLEPFFPNELFRHIIAACFLVVVELAAVIFLPVSCKFVNKPDGIPWFLLPVYRLKKLIQNEYLFISVVIVCALLFIAWPFLRGIKKRHLSLLCFLALSCLTSGCIVYPELAERGMKAPRSERCGDCHTDIYNEWKDSPHARSYTSAAFREETNGYRFTFCVGCHAPETIFTDKKIEPRGVNLSEGVNCNSCHLDDCKLSGPVPAHGPHPIAEKNLFYRTSELCGRCHVGTFKAWQESGTAGDRKTCQECHMPAIKRKLIQDDPWQKIYPSRDGRQHLFSFQTLSDNTNGNLLILAFTGVSHAGDKIEGVLEVENAGIPHTVPAGDYGYREVDVTIELLDGTGQIKDLKEEAFFVEMKTALKYREKRSIPFCFKWDKDSYMLRAKMTRVIFGENAAVLLAETTYKP